MKLLFPVLWQQLQIVFQKPHNYLWKGQIVSFTFSNEIKTRQWSNSCTTPLTFKQMIIAKNKTNNIIFASTFFRLELQFFQLNPTPTSFWLVSVLGFSLMLQWYAREDLQSAHTTFVFLYYLTASHLKFPHALNAEFDFWRVATSLMLHYRHLLC